MRFIDEAKIKIIAGHGGPGCVSFWREKFVPRGGPDGGDGGDGGSIVFKATVQLSTLQDFRYKREYTAPSGMHGSGGNKAGRDGEDLVIRIPVGTTVRDDETGEVLIDFMDDGQTWVACKGGRGGKGNSHFVTSTFQAPKFAQPGEAGEFKDIRLELKLLADAGIIGFPNAGKSTLISRMSAARPKIADYPFTTLTPNLGVVSVGGERSFVIADFPGLIEGAHAGMGLGHKFLKHMERARIYVHLLDGTRLLDAVTKPGQDVKDAVQALAQAYRTIRGELKLYDERLAHKPEILAINKIDLFASEPEILKKASLALRNAVLEVWPGRPLLPEEPFLLSAVSGQGVEELVNAIHREIRLDEKPTEVALPDQVASEYTEPGRKKDDE